MKKIKSLVLLAAMLLGGITAKAQCTDYTTVPYTTGFEGLATGALPACWTQVSTAGGIDGVAFPCAYNYSGNARNGSVYFEFEAHSPNGLTEEIVALPLMQNISGLKLTLWISASSSYLPTFQVGVLEDDSVFVNVQTLSLVTSTNWHSGYTEYTVYFNNYTGSGERIAMRAVGSSTAQYTLMIDDITVSEDNGCYPLVSISAPAIDSSSITLSWLDTMNSGISYTVTYWANGGDTTVVPNIYDTFYTASTLNSNTLYNFVVTPNCSTGDGIPTSASYRTTCGNTAVPYTEDFSSYTSGYAPDCWTVISGNPRAYNSSSNAHSGSMYLDFRGAYTNAIALPPLSLPTSSVQLSFWTRPESFTSSSCGSFSVGYMTDINVDSTFVAVGTWAYNEFSAYEEKIVQFPGAPDGSRIVLRQNANSTYYYWYVDDLSITEFSGCYNVTGITATDIDSTSLTLSWIDTVNTGASYTVTYWSNATDSVTTTAYDTTLAITGLNSNTVYYFHVATECSDGTVSGASSASFRTACGTLSLPYTEDFEMQTTSATPSCWTNLSGTTNVTNSSSVSHGGNNYLKFSGSTTNAVALPPTNQPTGDLQVRFWTRPEGYNYSSCGTFSVGYMTDLSVDSTWVELANWSYSEWTSNTYEEKEVPMTGAPDTAYIVLRQNAGSTNYYWYVDDLTVELTPSCSHPVSVSASNITATGADLSIVGDGSSYRIWWTDGTTVDSTDVSDTTYTFSGLTALTAYTVTVATICDDGTLTATVGTTFRTDCANGGCDVVINMVDSWGDGWSGNAINGYVNGTQQFSATLATGSNGTYTYRLCEEDTIVLLWNTGSYAYETSFTISIGGTTVASAADGSSYSTGDTLAYSAGCPSCIAPSAFTIDSVSSTTAAFHWTAGGFETDWELTIDSTTTVVSSNSYYATGLTANTLYNVTIRAICGSDDTSMALNGSFRTECGLISAPYVVDFEDAAYNGAWYPCWDSTIHAGTDPSVNYVRNHTTGGQYAMYMQAKGSESYNLVVAPRVNLAGNQLNVTFWAYLYASSGWIKAGVMTDPRDTSTFIPLATVQGVSGWNEYEFNTATLPDSNYRVAWLAYHPSPSSNGSQIGEIDDITIEQVSSCPRPNQPVVTYVGSDQIDLSFSGSTSGNYMLYITDGASYTDSVAVTADSTHSFTGLTPVTTYTITLYADCGTELSGSRTLSVTTTLVADSLPYSTGFEATDDVAWMLLNGTAVNQWVIDTAAANTGSRSLYISNDTGASNAYTTNSTSYAFAYKLFAFDSIGDYAISYDWRAYGESSYDYIRVALVPGSYEFVANGNNGISTGSLPSGWMALDGGSKLNLSSNWQNRSEVFSLTTAGNYYVLFYWRNDGSSGTQPPAAIDNVQIARVTCPAPQNLTLTAATETSLSFSWTPAGTESQWEVTFDGVSTLVSTSSYTASGLTSSSSHSVNVRAVCGAGDTSFAVNGTFRTTCGVISEFPWVEDFESTSALDCWSQEGNGTWTINSGDGYYSSTAHSGNYNARITHSSDGNVTKLITPVLALSAGTPATLTFWHTQRAWSGDQDSLVVYYRTSTADSWQRLTGYHNEISSWTCDTISLPNVTSTYQIAFEMYDGWGYGVAIDSLVVGGIGGGCAAPVISNLIADAESITVNYAASDTVEVYITDGAWSDNVNGTLVMPGTSSYTFTGLMPMTQYTIGVRQICDDSTSSSWTVSSVTTLDLGCLPPTAFTLGESGYSTQAFSWTTGNDETAWQIRIFNGTYDSNYSATTNPFTVTGLYPATTYQASIRSLCGENNNVPGVWGDTLTFTTDVCQPVTGVTVSNIAANSATVSWNAVSGSMGYKVYYGYTDFYDDEAATAEVAAGTTSYNMTGLESETDYEVYVLNRCTESFYSGIAEDQRVGFRTVGGGNGIYDVENGTLTLSPNPASSNVTLSVTGFDGEVNVEIVDMNGKRIAAHRTQNSELTIDVTSMAQGAYFVRVTGAGQTAVRKLIVR